MVMRMLINKMFRMCHESLKRTMCNSRPELTVKRTLAWNHWYIIEQQNEKVPMFMLASENVCALGVHGRAGCTRIQSCDIV